MAHAAHHAERGFTLLEVLLAFAILATVTTLMAEILSENMEKAADAIDKREMREIADTLFGKILFEQSEHRDGDGGSIDVDYGQWAKLPQVRADRYAMYRWSLSKTEMVAAGETEETDDAERLFDDDEDDMSSAPPGGTTGGTPGGTTLEKESVRLVRFTMKVYHERAPHEPLVVLSRLLPPPDFQAGTAPGARR